ncbi:ribosome silencing factor [Teredinibacter turnerae]|uniref:Ribosomal silencing factor RsfS n=1 Tax=Teredinibacter turnerae (strain ATCC 39867 / T7901) TaxID=377629 RepID=C5BNN1_TERTT|nr:ribosome silencing factor [Teredinibacter turnerae]ACR11887.1 polyA polymerase, iojap protein [Teredinibacter turnerae T7901]
MQTELNKVVINALEDLKGKDIVELDVRELSDVTDALVIVTGTSNRHVKSLANNVVEDGKEHDFRPIGVEGMESGEWVLVDYGDLVVHVMLETTRAFYELEKLWSTEPAGRKNNPTESP